MTLSSRRWRDRETGLVALREEEVPGHHEALRAMRTRALWECPGGCWSTCIRMGEEPFDDEGELIPASLTKVRNVAVSRLREERRRKADMRKRSEVEDLECVGGLRAPWEAQGYLVPVPSKH